MRALQLFLVLLLGGLSAGCAGLGLHREPILPTQIVEMAKAGDSAEAIIEKLRAAGTVYQLSAAEIVRLHEQGVPDPVLDYMQRTYIDEVRWQESRRAFFYRQPPYWYGHYYYPPWWW